MVRFFLLIIVIVCSFSLRAQPSNTKLQIPVIRKIFHDNIDASQQSILNSDGVNDDKFTPSKDSELNMQLTYAAVEKIDNLQTTIETDTSINNNNKVKFLRGLNEVLTGFINQYKYRLIKVTLFPDLINAFEEGMRMELNNQSLEPLIRRNDLDVGNILMKSIAFQYNVGADSCSDILLLKYCKRHPDKALNALNRNPEVPFADSLIILAAYKYPDQLYNYAASTNTLGNKIREIDDPLVKAISHMASTKSGRQYFPFLDNIYKGTMTFDEVDAVKDDSLKYFKLLVKTEIDYANRISKRDTPMGIIALRNKIQKTGEAFINIINGLHESPDAIRFKVIDPLSPQELYYLAVMEEEIIYTSSYVRGVYPRIFAKMKPPRGDSLLMSVNFDHFKKWIKIAANYNKLDAFLKSMEKDNAEILMKAFVKNLDKTQSLEDAVDVADSYASISDKHVKNLILNQVQYNLEQAKQNDNERATNIYSILDTLFLSMNDSNHIDVSSALGIEPVYFMPNKLMQDSTGKIIVQQFFYGDKGGKEDFSSFLNSFDNANWKISNSEEWVTITSTHGTKVIIYANKPLDDEKSLDSKAQDDLGDYLADNDLEPTMFIHRGHSYFLDETLRRLEPSAKVVLLGSCGGYQSLSRVLDISPEAQIIASKQTGSGTINQPMITIMMETLRKGKDFNWPSMWKSFSVQFKNNPLFEDYIPPYKNLGAVFLIAYNKLEEAE
ncbi:MAG: hypothetical protein ACR2FN_06530 [Chitinophagaceae bacterium]